MVGVGGVVISGQLLFVLDFFNPVLWFCRMENTVLGNALDGVPEESSEEGEKQNDSKIESADNLDGWC